MINYSVLTDKGRRYFKDMPAVVDFLELSRGENEKIIVEKLDNDGVIIERSDLSTSHGRDSVV